MNETTRTDKEALGRFLVRRLSEEDPKGAPLTVAELRKQLLPYPVCRDTLDMATKAEYDQAMLALMADEAWLGVEDEALEEALEEERSSPEPGLAFLGDFSASLLHPGPRLTEPTVEDDLEFLEELDPAVPQDGDEPSDAEAEETEAAANEEGAAEEENAAEDEAVEPAQASADGSSEGSGEPEAAATAPVSGACWSCDVELPDRPDVRFCPFCGEDQTAPECLECRAELELAWSYCPACGTATGRG